MRMPSPAVVEAHVLSMPPVTDGVQRIAQEVERVATDFAYERAFDEGTYAAKIRLAPADDPVRGRRRVIARDRKSEWVEEGTGIYGPTRRPIRPKRGKYLVFQVASRAGGPKDETVFATEVKGRPASWVMRDAAQRVAAERGLRFRNLRRFQG